MKNYTPQLHGMIETLGLNEVFDKNTSTVVLHHETPEILSVLEGCEENVYTLLNDYLMSFYLASVERVPPIKKFIPDLSLPGVKMKEGSNRWCDLLAVSGINGDNVFYESLFTSGFGMSTRDKIAKFNPIETYSKESGILLKGHQDPSSRGITSNSLRYESEHFKERVISGLRDKTHLRLSHEDLTDHGTHIGVINTKDIGSSGYVFDLMSNAPCGPIVHILNSNFILTHRLKTMSTEELITASLNYTRYVESKDNSVGENLTYYVQAKIFEDLIEVASESNTDGKVCAVPFIEFNELGVDVSGCLNDNSDFRYSAGVSVIHSKPDDAIFIKGTHNLVIRAIEAATSKLDKLKAYIKEIEVSESNGLMGGTIVATVLTDNTLANNYGILNFGEFQILPKRREPKYKSPCVELKTKEDGVIAIIGVEDFLHYGIIEDTPDSIYVNVLNKLPKDYDVHYIDLVGETHQLDDPVTKRCWPKSDDDRLSVQLVTSVDSGLAVTKKVTTSAKFSGMEFVTEANCKDHKGSPLLIMN